MPAVGLLLVHVPPDAVSVRVIDEPMQTVDEPDITERTGNALTVTGVVTNEVQPAAVVTV